MPFKSQVSLPFVKMTLVCSNLVATAALNFKYFLSSAVMSEQIKISLLQEIHIKL